MDTPPSSSSAAGAAGASSSTADIPDYFICPITLEMMRDPVISKCGHMFDKEAIYKWLKGEYDPSKRNISRACPVCHTVLDETAVSDFGAWTNTVIAGRRY